MNLKLNPALVDYLVQNSKEYSRYELDSTLLKHGYGGSEIEAAWEALAQPLAKAETPCSERFQ